MLAVGLPPLRGFSPPSAEAATRLHAHLRALHIEVMVVAACSCIHFIHCQCCVQACLCVYVLLVIQSHSSLPAFPTNALCVLSLSLPTCPECVLNMYLVPGMQAPCATLSLPLYPPQVPCVCMGSMECRLYVHLNAQIYNKQHDYKVLAVVIDKLVEPQASLKGHAL